MSPTHHLEADDLLAYATGTCDEVQALVVACHLTFCEACRQDAELLDDVGGELLGALEAADGSADGVVEPAWAKLPGRRNTPPARPRPRPIEDVPAIVTPFLAEPSRGWRFLAPGVRYVPLALGNAPRTVRIVRFRPGYRVPEHSHRGDETFVIFRGSLHDSRTQQTYRVGDLCRTLTGEEHVQTIGGESPCIALLVSDDRLVPKSLLGRLLQRIAGV